MKRYLPWLTVALLASCSTAQETPNSDAESSVDTVAQPYLVGEEITYTVDSVTMKGYLAYDRNAKELRPGVVVVHEWWGHNEHSRKSADRLAEAGYVAFALDMYGDGKTADHPEDAGAFAGAVMSNFDVARDRFNAALEILAESGLCDQDKVAAIGYCFGGGVVLNMLRQGADLDAVATFHGSIGAIEPAQPGTVSGRVLVMNGADDPFVSAEAIEEFKAEMTAAGIDFQFINYPGAIHGFTNPAATENGKKFDLPLAYSPEADSASWQELIRFLGATFP